MAVKGTGEKMMTNWTQICFRNVPTGNVSGITFLIGVGVYQSVCFPSKY